MAVANAELGKAQALLDEKQAELDKVQAKFDAAMNEKMVSWRKCCPDAPLEVALD